jgi:hypothetical protein
VVFAQCIHLAFAGMGREAEYISLKHFFLVVVFDNKTLTGASMGCTSFQPLSSSLSTFCLKKLALDKLSSHLLLLSFKTYEAAEGHRARLPFLLIYVPSHIR